MKHYLKGSFRYYILLYVAIILNQYSFFCMTSNFMNPFCYINTLILFVVNQMAYGSKKHLFLRQKYFFFAFIDVIDTD